MRSRSETKAVRAKHLLSTSTYWAVTPLSSPMGEYFLKMTSPSPVVKISSGSPLRMRWVRRISLGMTTRPSSSMRRTMPVAFIRFPSFPCSGFASRFLRSMVILWKQEGNYSFSSCRSAAYPHTSGGRQGCGWRAHRRCHLGRPHSRSWCQPAPLHPSGGKAPGWLP